MAPSSRDRISVDLRGMKAALLERARARGASPSDFVRSTLAEALGQSESRATDRSHDCARPLDHDRVRLSLRMSRSEAAATLAAARAAGAAPGAYVSALLAGMPALVGSALAERLAALVASNAAMATLARNLGQLASLFRQDPSHGAREYREMLDGVGPDVREHLALASAVLADLRPSRGKIALTRSLLA